MIRRVLTCLSFGGILFPALFSLALAGPWFRIQKSDAVPESTASFQWVTFNDTCPGKRFPTFTWSQNLALFFPQSETGPRQTYQLSIDLKNLGGHQLLSVAEFLAALGHAPDINSYTPVLHIKNGTSFKFNRIFEGIKIFFQSTPRAQVVYHHQGIGEPRAARQGLASLSELAIDPPHSIDHLRDLTQEISDLWLHRPSHISEEGARARSPSVFSETSGETVPHQEATLFPETLLQKKFNIQKSPKT